MICRRVPLLLFLVSSVLSNARAQPVASCCKGQELQQPQSAETKPAGPFVVDTLSFRTMDPFMVFKATQAYNFGGALQAYANFTGNGAATLIPPFGSRLTLPLWQGR